MEPTKKQVLEQLEKIVSSKDFASSPRKQNFLRYIVEKTLDGAAGDLKGYAIGVVVFERGNSFDPQNDTIVRVQARVLRRSLSLYNLSQGKNDPVCIELKKGSYVPTFRLVAPEASNNIAASSKTGILKPLSEWIPKNRAVCVILIAAFLSVSALLFMSVTNNLGQPKNGFDRASFMPMGPSISIAPFEIVRTDTTISGNKDTQNLQDGLHIDLIHKISRFKDLFVIEGADHEAATMALENVREPQFELVGSIQRSGDKIRVISVLKRHANGQILWTRTHSETLDSPSALMKIQSKIAIDVATSLGQPYGGINSQFMSEQSNLSDLHLDHYFCLMGFYRYNKAKSEPQHKIIRDCLETATSEMPSFSSGWAALSWIYADEGFNKFNVRADSAPPTERALEAARRAVEEDPDNAMAHQYLAMAKFTMGDDQGFLESAETALDLNPNDPEILAIVGNYLLRIGREEQGVAMVKKALALNQASPPWYHASIAVYYYMQNELDAALYHGRIYLRGESLSALILNTAVLARAGQVEDANKSYLDLVNRYPEFPNQYENIIKSRRMPDGLYVQIIDDLIIAGLAPAL